jgi:hypothetical protein
VEKRALSGDLSDVQCAHLLSEIIKLYAYDKRKAVESGDAEAEKAKIALKNAMASKRRRVDMVEADYSIITFYQPLGPKEVADES